MHLRRIAGCCLALWVSACQTVSYEYKAPESAEGRQCIVQCASIREVCRTNENQRAQAEKKSCERRSETTYLVCMEKAKDNKDQQKECDKRHTSCYAYPSDERCGDEYNQCFSNCGGTVQKIITK